VGFAGEDCSICAPGYFGADCLPCPNGAAEPCYLSGTCSDGKLGTGLCECFANFSGPACEFSRAANCSGHGMPDDQGECSCDYGWTGAECDQCLPGFYGTHCLECDACVHGSCNGNGTRTGNGTCMCDISWAGPDCTEYIGPCEPNPCQNGGVCIDTWDWNYTCSCPGHYTGRNCDMCENGYFGPECTACPACQLGVCDQNINGTGQCLCVPTAQGTLCEECKPLWYGQNCTGSCECQRGVCNDKRAGNGSCACEVGWANAVCSQCAPGFYGANCTTPKLPCPLSATFQGSDAQDIVVSFRVDMANAVDARMGSVTCSSLLTFDTLMKIGQFPRCKWTTLRTFTITPSPDAIITKNDLVQFVPGLLTNTERTLVCNGNNQNQYVPEQDVNYAKINGTVPCAVAVLSAPQTVGATDGFTLDGSASYGLAGRTAVRFTYDLVSTTSTDAAHAIRVKMELAMASGLGIEHKSIDIPCDLLLPSTTYVFSLVVVNGHGQSCNVAQVTVEKLSQPTSVLVIEAPSSVPRSRDAILNAVVYDPSGASTASAFTFEWALSATTACAGVTIDPLTKSTRSLYLPAFRFEAMHQYTFTVSATRKDGLHPPLVASWVVDFTPSELVATIDGGDTLVKPTEVVKTTLLSGMRSSDPDYGGRVPDQLLWSFQIVEKAGRK